MQALDYYRQTEFAEAVAGSIYLNHAGISPSPSRVVRAVTEAVQWAGRSPVTFFMECGLPAITSARTRLARMMGVSPEHLALTKNTGHGLSIVADGLKLEPGDNIVTAECEYPAVVYPWKAQAWRGIETRLVKPRPDGTIAIEDVEALMDSRTRALAISWIQFGTGFRADLAAFTALAHAHNALIIVDVIQGLGAFPVQSEALGLDIVATGAHKWLMAPPGTGGLYIAPHVIDRMNLVNMGAASVVDVVKFDPLDFNPKPTAQRYEEGSPNALGLVGLDAALSLLEEVGVERSAEQILALTGYGAKLLLEKGYEVASPLEDEKRAGLLMFSHPQHSNEVVMQALGNAKVAAAVRGGRVRFSPHFYNTFEEIAAAVAALPE